MASGDLEQNQETIRAINPNHSFIASSLTNNAFYLSISRPMQ